MGDFGIYFQFGLEHILDIADGYDHILFVIALCAVYTARDWRQVLILVTAFTLGHSITLALATFGLVKWDPALIEFLIPVTIFLTAIGNLARPEQARGRSLHLNYVWAACFGLIHGLGFSNFLRAILGRERIVSQLFAFNIGLEVGQVVVVALFMLMGYLAITWLRVNRRDWTLVISSMVAGMALLLIKESDFLAGE